MIALRFFGGIMASIWSFLVVIAPFCLVTVSASPAVFSLDIQRQSAHSQLQPLHNRRSTVSTTLIQISEKLYLTNVTVGTPPQNVQLFVDVNAADTWVNTPVSAFCAKASNNCAEYGIYAPNSSSSYQYVNSNFSLTYSDGTGESGDYVTDVISIGGNSVQGLQFAIAYNSTAVSTSPYGVLGLGYPVQEVQVTQNHAQPYPNLPQAMANKGMINSNAFSLWLNDLSASTGSLLFGGVDTAKYTGDLRTIPIVPRTTSNADLIVPLTDIHFGDDAVFSSQNLTATLDSATTLTYLPKNATNKLYDLVGAKLDSSLGVATIDCSQANIDITLDFTLSWPVVNVTMSELVIRDTDDSQSACYFGVLAAPDDSTAILGDTFLRSAYVVYDLSNNELSIARTRFNVTTSTIVEITNSINGVPGAIRAPSATPTSTPNDNDSGQYKKSPLSVGASVGIGIGGLAAILLLGIALFLWRKKKRARADAALAAAGNGDTYTKSELPGESLTRNELGAADSPELPYSEKRHELQGEGEVAELPGSRPAMPELDGA